VPPSGQAGNKKASLVWAIEVPGPHRKCGSNRDDIHRARDFRKRSGSNLGSQRYIRDLRLTGSAFGATESG
jgi:hypothetical protein